MTATRFQCGSCGTELPPDSRFCNKCGAPITPAATSAEYKHVTVLFAEVVVPLRVTSLDNRSRSEKRLCRHGVSTLQANDAVLESLSQT
jgi:hypothetical protein